jgi:hypothetical protein
METTTAQTEEMSSVYASDFVYEAIKGLGKVGGYVYNALAETMYYAGKYFAYVRKQCTGLRVPVHMESSSEEGKLTVMRLVKSDAAIDEADKIDFYMKLGRDLVTATKSGLESENLTIIDLSKYEV